MTLKIQAQAKHFAGEVLINFFRYQSGELGILITSIHNEPFAKATVSAEPYGAPQVDHDAEVWVKDYSENEGVLETLVACGVLQPASGEHQLGQATLFKCALTDKAIAEAKVQGVIK